MRKAQKDLSMAISMDKAVSIVMVALTKRINQSRGGHKKI
jgi:hypothetical protein